MEAGSIFESCVVMVQPELERKHQTMTVEKHTPNPYLYMDTSRILEVTLNLVSNAIKYTGDGGHIRCAIRQLPSDREGWCVQELSVADNGIGMSEEFQQHIFEAFARERSSTVSGVEGSGLGMGIVKKLVDLMDGSIDIQSKLGEGSTFTVHIPCRLARQEDAVPKCAAGRVDKTGLAGRRILLAEDNDLNAEIATELMGEEGLLVDRAENGARCLEMLEKAPAGMYDAILMDVQMPVLDGYEATRKIRRLEDPWRANIPIIAITANAFADDVYRARRSRGKVWLVLLWILAGLIVLAVILFYAGQKYIVYGSDGSLHVVFPIMETPAPVTDDGQPETVDTELVLEDPDYSGIISDAGKDLSELHAQYLTADKITPEGLTRAAASVKAAGGNALVLQMKSPGGTLSWKSGVSEASAYGVNGTAELADAIQTVKGQNIYLVAVVSTCVDSLMAERYAATAQQTASGSAYTDSSGGWVDPYNTFTRTYLVSLCKELRELGFDEVAFSYLQQPLAAAELKYAGQTGSPSRTDAVVALAKYLRANLTATGLRVSAIVSADSILQKQAELSGQDMTVLPKLLSAQPAKV